MTERSPRPLTGMTPIDTPPFHAAAFGLSDLGTKGGLRTDARARVLNRDGDVIPGLYAAGNTMAAVSGTTYPGGDGVLVTINSDYNLISAELKALM